MRFVALLAAAAAAYEKLSAMKIISEAKAKDMDLVDALLTVKDKLPRGIQEMISTGRHTEALIALGSVDHHHHKHHRKVAQDPAAAPAAGPAAAPEDPFTKAVGFINTELVAAQEKVDIVVYDCNTFRTEKETLLLENSNMLTALGSSIAQATATIAQAKGTLATLNTQLADLQAEFDNEKAVCKATIDDLEAQIAALSGDLATAEMIQSVAAGECKPKDSTTAAPAAPFLLQSCAVGGKTELRLEGKIGDQLAGLKSQAAQEALQAVLADSLDEADDEGEAEAKSVEVADGDVAEREKAYQQADRMQLREHEHAMSFIQVRSAQASMQPTGAAAEASPLKKPKCTTGGKVDCGSLMDKIDQMVGDIRTEKDAIEAEHKKVRDDCDQRRQQKETQITDLNQQVAESETILAEATATMLKDTQSQQNAETEKVTLEGELKARMDTCHNDITDIESSLCALSKVRNALFKQIKKENPMIQDCVLSDWVEGECSVPCGGKGMMQVSRNILSEPGEHGAKCSPAKLERECDNGPCPIDCVMGEWSEWSKCTKECGGGVQSHTRNILKDAQYGGKPCEELSSSRACSTHACDVDCVLGEWTSYGSCSRACKSAPQEAPGKRYRMKHVKEPAQGNGACPHPNAEERLESQDCNDKLCPVNARCNSAMDAVLIYDGSGSVRMRGPKETRDEYFNLQKGLVSDIIINSGMGWDDYADAPAGARFAVMQFSTGLHLLNRLAEKKEDQDKAKLLQLIKDDKWMQQGTAMSKALTQAGAVLKESTPNRLSVVLLMTDGQPNNRRATLEAAEALKKGGIRIVTAPIGSNVPIDFMCEVSSAPCSENMLRVANMESLATEAKRFLVGLCPDVEEAKPLCPRLSLENKVANWGLSFDRQGWSTVYDGDHVRSQLSGVMTGLGRSGGNNLFNLERAHYAVVEGVDRRSEYSAFSLNMWGPFDHAGKHSCPTGTFLGGFWRNNCEPLYCIEEFACVRGPWKEEDKDCEWFDVTGPFDNAGDYFCPAGKAMKGLERSGGQSLVNIEKFQCCAIPDTRKDGAECTKLA